MENTKGDQVWLRLFKQAVMEHDRKRLILRIYEAHKAIQDRERELWYDGCLKAMERERLHAARHFLVLVHLFGNGR